MPPRNASRLFLILALPIAGALSTLQAQTPANIERAPAAGPAGAAQRTNIETYRRLQAESAARRALPDTLAAWLSRPPDERDVPPLAPGEGPSVKLRQIEFNDSEFLTRQELDALTARYLKRRVTIGDLYQLLEEIRALYRKKGQLASTAILPPQKLEKGLLRIQLVEARVSKVNVEGNKRIAARYLQSAAGLRELEGKTLDLPALEDRLVRFNKTNLASFNAELEPGADYGETAVKLTLTEPPPFEFLAASDNSGRENLGTWRGLLLTRANNLLHWSDTFVFSGTLMEGAKSFYVAYDFPIIPRWGTRLVTSYTAGTIEVVDGPNAELGIEGDSKTFDVHIDQPVWMTAASKLTLHAGYTYSESNSDVAGFSIEELSAHAVSTGVSFERLDPYGLWYAYMNLKWSKASTLLDDLDYTTWNFSLSRTQKFTPWLRALATIGGQLASSENIPSIDQFQIGGINSVRGYPEGLLFGHNAWFARIELAASVPKIGGNKLLSKLTDGVELFAFYDYGAIEEPKLNLTRLPNEIHSVGGGVRWRILDRLFASVTYAEPLTGIGDGFNDQRFLFRFELQFP